MVKGKDMPVHEADEVSARGYWFEGLSDDAGTMFPNILIDEVMANLTGAEFKVLAYIVRRTLPFKRASDTISLEQICSGVKTDDGVLVDAGTGLSKKTAIAALKGLRDKGVIVADRRAGGDNLPTALALRFREP